MTDSDPIKLLTNAVLKLEAEKASLLLIVGFLLRNSPQALKELEYVAQHIDELTLPQPLTEAQREVVAITLRHTIEHQSPKGGA